MVKSRDNKLDILRAIGLLGIILAHVSPPEIVQQLRTFDVILLVIVSGVSYSKSDEKNVLLSYYIHRIKRLILPVWTFLIIYFVYFSIIDLITDSQIVTFEVIYKSFLLFSNDSIGYLWIIKVFILVALSTPIIEKYNKSIKGNGNYFLFVFILMSLYLVIQNFILNFSFSKECLFYKIVSEYIFYMIPYSLIFSIGLRIDLLKSKKLVGFNLILILLLLLIERLKPDISFMDINSFKYPPQDLWVTYGVGISVLLYLIVKRISFFYSKFFYFLSSSSIWIYLWHIFILKNWGYGISHIPIFFNHYLIKFIAIVALASLITYFQHILILSVVKRLKVTGNLKKHLEIMFLK